MENAAAWKRLGETVVRERVALGMRTTKALADAMGLTARIVGDLENGRRLSYSPSTLAALESALGWQQGSVGSVLSGGEPAREPVPSAAQETPLVQSGFEEPRSREEAQAMLTAVLQRAADVTDRWAVAVLEARRANQELDRLSQDRVHLEAEAQRLMRWISQFQQQRTEEEHGHDDTTPTTPPVTDLGDRRGRKPMPDARQAAARRGVPDNPPDTTTGEESQDPDDYSG